MNSTNSKIVALSSRPISHALTMFMDFVGTLLSYCQTLGPRNPIYSVRKTHGTWQCTLSLPFTISVNMPKDFMIVQSTKPLAMSVSACIACTLLLQQGRLDSNLMPFSDVNSVPKLTTFGNNVLTSDKQEELGLVYMDGGMLRVALSPYSKI